ncbi:GntR family transcriptional regulator [Verrucomicrobiaceae bacterium 227]
MDNLPRKHSLPEAVLKWLQGEIRSGNFESKLPSERTLCDRLHISRSTLRIAIAQLRKEGWIEVVNKRSLIRYTPSKDENKNHLLKRKKITFLSPVRLEEMTWMGLVLYSELGRHLADTGASIQHAFKPGAGQTKLRHRLDQFIRDSRSDAWILYRTSYDTQKFFQENAIPAVLFGNAHKGIHLPALTIDYPAALCHSLGALSRLKHDPKRILLILPDTKLAGNIELKETFYQSLGKQASRQILLYREATENTPQIIKNALVAIPRPTAIITLRTRAAIQIHGILGSLYGLAIPKDISLICLEDAPFMRHLVPQVSRYRVESAHVTRFVSSALNQLLSSGMSKPWGHRPLIPEYVKGESLGRAPGP